MKLKLDKQYEVIGFMSTGSATFVVAHVPGSVLSYAVWRAYPVADSEWMCVSGDYFSTRKAALHCLAERADVL